jgi:hypothetical protein
MGIGWRATAKRGRRLLKGLREHAELNQRVMRLQTIPDVGEVLALTWALEVGEVKRFPSIGEASYSGLTSAQRGSAGQEQREPTFAAKLAQPHVTPHRRFPNVDLGVLRLQPAPDPMRGVPLLPWRLPVRFHYALLTLEAFFYAGFLHDSEKDCEHSRFGPDFRSWGCDNVHASCVAWKPIVWSKGTPHPPDLQQQDGYIEDTTPFG